MSGALAMGAFRRTARRHEIPQQQDYPKGDDRHQAEETPTPAIGHDFADEYDDEHREEEHVEGKIPPQRCKTTVPCVLSDEPCRLRIGCPATEVSELPHLDSSLAREHSAQLPVARHAGEHDRESEVDEVEIGESASRLSTNAHGSRGAPPSDRRTLTKADSHSPYRPHLRCRSRYEAAAR
jgi:hypothetical protein